ncbi:MAG: family 43 glycosylhydrolase [Candidatus Promineofilum sp.]|nr:family 43 glycosylhydrolase [Promineifilum sp.]
MKRRIINLLTGLLILLAACQSGAQDDTVEPTADSQPITVAATATAGSPASPTDAGDTFENPVFRRDFPDPGIIRVGDTYYAYSTNAASRNVPLATSTDLVTWDYQTDAMPALPSWSQLGGGYVWAPEVIEIDGSYVLYYTARDKAADKQCIGVAVSDKPEGKFKDTRDAAFVCQVEEGGSIDASPFRDADGTLYLYWKNDGNCCNMATYIYVQELSPDGLALVGEPTRLVRNDRAWEGRVVEAPTMWLEDSHYTLFFTANDYGSPAYAVGYARCETAVGPCEDAPENPILSSVLEGGTPVIGPGHQTIILDKEGEPWMAYHAWQVTSSGTRGNARYMWLDRLTWEGDAPRVLGPTTAPQPLPGK